MRLSVVTPPTGQVVSVVELRAHARLDDWNDAADLTAKIAAAVARVEALTGRALLTRTVREVARAWPTSGLYAVGMAPLVALTSATVGGVDLTSSVVTIGDQLVLEAPPSGVVDLVYSCGYGGAANVPADLRHAALMLAAHWARNREPVEPMTQQSMEELPHGVSDALQPYLRWFV